MIHRTYILMLPSTASIPIDIVLTLPGSQTAPVAAGGGAGKTAPPAGWNGADGAYYEWRGLPVRFETLVGATPPPNGSGFAPRGRLGWKITTHCLNSTVVTQIPEVLPSPSVIATLGGAGGIPTIALTEPSYGPVIRVVNTVASGQSTVWAVHLDLFEVKDDDRSPTGI